MTFGCPSYAELRTTVISPGAVATELPESSTDSEAAEQMRTFYDGVAIPADSFARAVAFAMSQPDTAVQGQTPPESEIVAAWQLASLGEGDGRERQQRQQTDDGSRKRVTHVEIPSL